MLSQNEALLVELGVIAKALQIVQAKRQDYSGQDDPFRNLRASSNLGIDPIIGCLIRESDKNSRIAALIESGLASEGGRVGESLLDTFADKINYTGIEAGLYAEMSDDFRREVADLGQRLLDVLKGLDVTWYSSDLPF